MVIRKMKHIPADFMKPEFFVKRNSGGIANPYYQPHPILATGFGKFYIITQKK